MPLSPATRNLLFALVALFLLAISSVSVIAQNEQAVVLRLGKPDRMINRFTPGSADGSGVIVHIPFVEQVIRLDRSLVSFAVQGVAVRSSDGQQRQLDFTGKYRIIDPVRLVNSVGSEEKLTAELASVLPALVQSEFGRLDSATMALPGADGAWQRITAALDARARAYGVQVIDLRVQRTVLTEGALQATYGRMKDDREAQALSIADNGLQQALRIRTEAEISAARIIGEGAARDPEFYDFYRAMISYERMFADPKAKGRSTLILSPDSPYLRAMNERN
ncbi:SPFH domain-containing protein [Novosphingobium sp.]|uniref:SPFH domain-containing protein n=1 Tax=Novosphingobium sp. TaxID=1874826 RepID=UPI0035B3857F